jgi:predicted DCC family thiol-disulfide oxidoreductase YuxK
MNAPETFMDSAQVPTRLTILYDERCALCLSARDWLLTQPCLVPVELLASGSDDAKRRYGSLPWLGRELVAVDENGNVWVGPPAFLASMWATARYRSWAFRLSRPGLEKHAERFFRWVSRRRDRWGAWIARDEEECSWCENERETMPSAARSVEACVNGHLMRKGQKFCTVCGWPNVS